MIALVWGIILWALVFFCAVYVVLSGADQVKKALAWLVLIIWIVVTVTLLQC